MIGMDTSVPTNWCLFLIVHTLELNRNGLPAETVSKASLSQEEITNRLDYWHEEAMELHDMARRREREADVLLKDPKGASSEGLVRMRALAKQLHAAAEYADDQAHELSAKHYQTMPQ